MTDIGDKEFPRAPRPRIQVGDRVEIGTGDEYDIGTVVASAFNGVRVHWDKADETYSENPAELRRVPDEVPR